MVGTGNLLLMVKLLKSMIVNIEAPTSIFLTNKIGEENELVLCLIIHVDSISWINLSISVFWKCGYLYGGTFTGVEFGFKLIWWEIGCMGVTAEVPQKDDYIVVKLVEWKEEPRQDQLM